MVRKAILFLSFFSIAFASDDVTKISEAMGHLIGRNLQSLGLEIDIDAVVKGMNDEATGKSSPMNEEECVEAIALLQEQSLTKIAIENLEAANQFLEENGKREGVISLEQGKLQYEVLEKGKGQEVHSYNSPLVRLNGKLKTGESIGVSEEVVSLDNAILGFSKGLLGMKEGEKRTLYIHPDLGYGKEGNIEPNALLIFEVELLRADASFDAKAASDREMLHPIIPESEFESELEEEDVLR